MKQWLVAVAGFGVLLAGCGAQQTVAPQVPAVLDGIPVHALSWQQPLPYVNRQLYVTWRTVAPGTYKISAKSAVLKVLRYWASARPRIKAVYVLAAGMRDVKVTDPLQAQWGQVTSAYIVEVVGPKLNLGWAPAPITPPKEDFDIFWVNGRTGAMESGTGGSWPLPALWPNAAPPQPIYNLIMTSTVYKIEPVGFTDLLHWWVISGHLDADPGTGCLLAYDLRHLKKAPTVVLVPGAGDVRITGFSGDKLVYVHSASRGTGTFHLGSEDIDWKLQ